MTEPSKWNFIESVFFDALDLPVEERERFVRDRCAGDSNSAEEVLSLLEAHFDGPPLIDGSLLTLGMKILAGNASDDESPAQVGRYRITRELGHGGMAVVYLAEREEGDFQHRVAVKVMRGGRESRSLLARFVTERQVLATLDHPNIARLYDGGVTERGVPYIVMEYVDGAPFLEYCRKNLPELEDRLRLFTKVCDAVQHAHRNLIVHRDLKPGNILVMADGTPKLLDFGIAKIFRDDFKNTLAQTAAEERLLTPAYASPEQIRGKNITTATDVYSLGVIFYELLSGDSPYSKSRDTYEELIAAICDRESVRPSAAVENAADEDLSEVERRRRKNRVSGDLDIIALKALAKDPARRYASVDQMAEDIRRHLDGRPISARPDTVRYRVTKFVKRNRWQTAAAVLVMASMLSGAGVALWQARKAELERVKAEQSQKKAKDRADSIQKLCGDFIRIHNEIKDVPGATNARKLVLELGVNNLDILASDTPNDPLLLLDLARAYKTFGDLQGRPSSGNLGDLPGALRSYESAEEILGKIIKENSPDIEALVCSIEIDLGISGIQERTGALNLARRKQRNSVKSLENLLKLNPPSSIIKNVRRKILIRDAIGQALAENYESGIEIMAQVIECEREDLRKNSTEFDVYLNLSSDLMKLGRIYEMIAERFEQRGLNFSLFQDIYLQKSHDCFLEAKEILNDLKKNKSAKDYEGGSLDTVSSLYVQNLEFLIKKKRRSLDDFEKGIDRLRKISVLDRNDLEARYDFLYSFSKLGVLYRKNKQEKKAIHVLLEAEKLYFDLIKLCPNNAPYKRELVVVEFNLAEAFLSAGSSPDAVRYYIKVIQSCIDMIENSPESTGYFSAHLIPAILRMKKNIKLNEQMKLQIESQVEKAWILLKKVEFLSETTESALLILGELSLLAFGNDRERIADGLLIMERLVNKNKGRNIVSLTGLAIAEHQNNQEGKARITIGIALENVLKLQGSTKLVGQDFVNKCLKY